MSQSRWVQEFEQHPFQGVWRSLKLLLLDIEVTDPSEVNSVMELARLKRLVSYVDGIVGSIDPELVPKSIWANFNNQALQVLNHLQEYKVNNSASTIVSANDQADNLLSYVRPWMVTPVEAIGAVRNAATEYTSSLERQVRSFVDSSSQWLEDIRESRSLAANRLKGVNRAVSQIEAFAEEIFEQRGDVESLDARIRSAVNNSESLQSEVTNLHAKLLIDQPEQKSVLTSVSEAQQRIIANDVELKNILGNSRDRIEGLREFHQKIFGTKDEETGKEIPGLKSELEERAAQIDKYEGEQHIRHDKLFKKIEALLPGANSAGLASAYRTMKMGFDKPIKNYTIYFYCSLALLGFGSLLLWVENISIWPPSITFVGIKPWEELLRGLLGRAAFFIPVVWLAVFSATRRSQYERLQQEYAHKETFASSYDSYKKELKELGEATSDLQKQLLDKAILAVAFNASSTLDGKNHVEKPPTLKFLEGVDPEVLKKLVEAFATAKPGR